MQRFLTGGEQADNPYQSMSITTPGPCTLWDQKRLPKPYALKATNNVNDIEGAVAYDKFAKFDTRPAFDAARDFPESLPKPKTHTRNDPDRQLMTQDIDGAQFTLGGGMDRTNRHVNPLEPVYKLPTYKVPISQHNLVTAPPARDTMMVKDINADPNPKREIVTNRHPLDTSDIEGAHADYNGFKYVRERMADKMRKSFEAKGLSFEGIPSNDTTLPFSLTNKRFSDRTNRHTNPAAPAYFINGIKVEDDPVHTKPKALKSFIPGGTFSLYTQDVPGATAENNPKHKPRTEVRNIMNTQDVEGAQADTVQHSIRSDRVTCPLFPVYKSLDDGSALAPSVNALMPKEHTSIPNLRTHAKNVERVNTSNLATTGAMTMQPMNSAPQSARQSAPTSQPISARSNNNNNNVPQLDLGNMSAREKKAAIAKNEEIRSVRDLPQ